MKNLSIFGIVLFLFLFGSFVEARPLDEIKKSGEIRICLAGSAHEYYQSMGEVFARWLNVTARIKRLDSWDHQFHNRAGKTEKEQSYTPVLLQNGTCDIYPNDLVMNDWRKKKLAFVKLFQSQVVVFVHKDRFGEFKEITDLQGKIASVMKNSSYHNWIEKNNQSTLSNNPVRFVFLKTYDAWAAVRQKKADFTISNASGILKELDGKARELRIAFSVGKTSDIGWALSRDDKNLMIVLEMFVRGQLRKNSEFDTIWLKKGLGLVEYMAFDKKLNGQDNSFNLSPEEKAYLREHPVLRVHNEKDWPPFDFADDGVPKGYTIDLVNLALEKIGAQVKWINGYNWGELIDLFNRGKIHILPAIYKTEERNKYIDFTFSYAANPSVLVTHSDNSRDKSLKDLKGRKVASISSYSIAEKIALNYPEIEQVHVKNPKEALQAVSDKRVDAFVGSIGAISYILDRNYIPNVKVVGDSGLLKPGDTALHMGVAKKREIQGRILQKGLSAISKTEIEKLEKRWLPLIQHRKDRDAKVALSYKQTDWLVDHPEFTMGDDYVWPPFTFLNKKGEFSGIASGYINLISDRLGLTFNPVFGLNWSEVMEKIKNKSLDIIPAISFSEKRASYLDFTKPYFKTPIVIATRKDGAFVDKLEDLSGKRVGVIKGYITQEQLSKNYPDILLVPQENLGSGIQALFFKGG